MKATTENKLLLASGAKQVLATQRVQELWSGYGEIVRCRLAGGPRDSVIVKHVRLSAAQGHPRGWHTSISHARKERSYVVEQAFYELDAPIARVCTAEVPIPYAKHLEEAALPQPDKIVAAVRGLFGQQTGVEKS